MSSPSASRWIRLALLVVLSPPSGAFASPYSEQPRLPDDMRDLAQHAADDFKKQNYDAAATDYGTMIRHYPDSLYAWSNLGVARSQQGHLSDAVQAFEHARKLQPLDAFTLVDLALVYLQLDRFDDAIAAAKAALVLEPNNVWAHSSLAEAYQKIGKKTEADGELRRARELSPSPAPLVPIRDGQGRDLEF